MKPTIIRNRRLTCPALLLLPTIIHLSSAGVINPDSEGNITIASGNIPGNTILASGGTSAAPTVVINAGAILTGDAALQLGTRVSSPGYTLENSGSVSGAMEGVLVQSLASSSFTLTNRANGIIQGGSDAIYLDSDGGTITNFGIIRGINSATSDGIEGFNNLTVTNSGQISGQAGIFADDLLTVFNQLGGSISTVATSNEAGIEAFDFAEITNFGSISSSGAEAIFAGNSATIFNSSSLDSNGSVIAGGQITGATDGVLSLNFLSLVNERASRITGTSGFGVSAGDDAEIFNDAGAEIRGGFGGIRIDDFGFVENDGSIFGNGGDAIRLGADGEIFNTGLIDGATGIVTIGDSLTTNSGTIRTNSIGGNAFSGGIGADDLILNLGSLIQGNTLGGGGVNTLVFNGGMTSPTSTSNIVRGSVSNFSTITKNGTGLALIGAVADVGSGLSITADTININSGALYFNSDITGASLPKTTINARGAAIGGTGLWNADLNLIAGGFSAGAIPINLDLIPANAVGSVALSGDVLHSPGSFIRHDIVPGTAIIDGINSDIIEQIGIGNTYNLAGANLRIASTDVNQVLTPGTYTIIDSDDAIIGFPAIGTVGVQFNANTPDTGFIAQPLQGGTFPANFLTSVLTTRFLTLGLENGGTNLVMNINYGFGAIPGLSQNAALLGGALDTQAALAGTGTLPLAQQDFIAALAFSDLTTVQNTLASITPVTQFGLTTAVVNSNYRLHRLAENHLATARSGHSAMAEKTTTGTESKASMSSSSSGVTSTRFTTWGSFSYDAQDYNSDSAAEDFDGETGAFTAGFDYRIAPNLLLGLMLDGSKSDYDSQGGSSDIDSFRVAAYGTWGASMGLYSDFLIGYGTHDLDQSRQLAGLAAGTSSSSSTDADSFQALATLGFAMGTERLKHGPFVGFEYQTVGVDGYNQSGPVPIGVSSYDVDSFRSLIGYRIQADLGKLQPYASIAYAHEFGDDRADTTASLPGGTAFRISGADQSSAILLSLGTAFTLNNSLSLDVGYRGEIATEDTGIDSHGGSVGLRFSF